MICSSFTQSACFPSTGALELGVSKDSIEDKRVCPGFKRSSSYSAATTRAIGLEFSKETNDLNDILRATLSAPETLELALIVVAGNTMEEVVCQTSCFPATAALELALKVPIIPMQQQRNTITGKEEIMLSKKSLKRSRSIFHPFDVAELLDATKPVEESIAFPCIEWDFDDEEDEEHSTIIPVENNATPTTLDDFDDLSIPRKRHCRGLVRSKQVKCNLAQLLSLAS
jgi:hypothetical protein